MRQTSGLINKLKREKETKNYQILMQRKEGKLLSMKEKE